MPALSRQRYHLHQISRSGGTSPKQKRRQVRVPYHSVFDDGILFPSRKRKKTGGQAVVLVKRRLRKGGRPQKNWNQLSTSRKTQILKIIGDQLEGLVKEAVRPFLEKEGGDFTLKMTWTSENGESVEKKIQWEREKKEYKSVRPKKGKKKCVDDKKVRGYRVLYEYTSSSISTRELQNILQAVESDIKLVINIFLFLLSFFFSYLFLFIYFFFFLSFLL